MADVFSKKKRSEVMSRIRSRGNKETELALAALLRAHGITGWRRHVRVAVERRKSSVERKSTSPRPSPRRGEGEAISGSRPSSLVSRLVVRPDFVFRQVRLAIFVDGCFWHGCPKHSRWPESNRLFWRNKFLRNKARDRLVTRTLRVQGWRVLRIWEHELARKNEGQIIRRIQRALL